MNYKILTGFFIFAITALLNTALFAQAEAPREGSTETFVYMMLAGLLFTLAVLFASIMIFESYERKPKKAKTVLAMASESDLLIKDHEYDGIHELDNPPPAWFQFLFYITIAFALFYFINFHVLKKSNSSFDEYMAEVTAAQMQKDELIRSGALINENNVALMTETADLSKGKEIFTVNCVSCHGENGGGTVGPNLTDQYWIHGGGIKNVFATVSNGVPAKGMITWKTQLNPKQIQQVSSYVLTFQGTNPVNGKPPEGNIWVDTTATSKTDSLKK